MDWVVKALKQFAVFKGRSRRREYWFFSLFVGVVSIGLFLIAAVGRSSNAATILLGIFFIAAMTVPSIAVTVRRLHDTGRSGWWYFIGVVPFGGLVLLVFMLLDGQPGANRYGPSPKGLTHPGA